MYIRVTPRQLKTLKNIIKTVNLKAFEIPIYNEILKALDSPIDEYENKIIETKKDILKEVVNTSYEHGIKPTLSDPDKSIEFKKREKSNHIPKKIITSNRSIILDNIISSVKDDPELFNSKDDWKRKLKNNIETPANLLSKLINPDKKQEVPIEEIENDLESQPYSIDSEIKKDTDEITHEINDIFGEIDNMEFEQESESEVEIVKPPTVLAKLVMSKEQLFPTRMTQKNKYI